MFQCRLKRIPVLESNDLALIGILQHERVNQVRVRSGDLEEPEAERMRRPPQAVLPFLQPQPGLVQNGIRIPRFAYGQVRQNGRCI